MVETIITKEDISMLIESMSIDEKICQVLCFNSTGLNAEQMKKYVKKYPVGSIFYAYRSKEECKEITQAVQSVSRIPVIACGDLVNGAGSRIKGCTLFPWQMAVGAANSEDLAEKMGEAIAIEGRACGIHWTFGPIVDLNINIANSMMHTRSFGENPDHVLRIAKAYIRGVQKKNLMAASAKHFPGDGIDDRDSHICTSVNNLSKDEWYKLYGKVWQGVIDDGVMAIMMGHIALPWLDPGTDYLGPKPGTLSKKIQTDLLRKELGFKGCIISDAIPMAGFTGQLDYEKSVPMNIETGSDMVLWAEPERDIESMKKALKNGTLREERLDEAVHNVLSLKMKVGLWEEEKEIFINSKEKRKFISWADEIGEKSITVVRNEDHKIPVKLKPGSKILTVDSVFDNDTRGYIKDLSIIDQELCNRGFKVKNIKNPPHAELTKIAPDYQAVFINLHIMPRYGTTRLYGHTAGLFWSGIWHTHPCVIITSFGDPYKLYELPFLPNMVQTYSNTPSSQKAAVRVWLGEIEPMGEIPVNLNGFFNATV